MRVLAPVAVGELVDKVTILALKLRHCRTEAQRGHVEAEHAALREVARSAGIDLEDGDAQALAGINEALWAAEEAIRVVVTVGVAGEICALNDARAAVKRRINERYESEIVEEKVYH